VSTRRQREQHHKGKKRPGHWHQGAGLAREQVPRLEALAAAEQRGRTADDELRAVASRYHEDIDVWQSLAHAAPFVPRIAS
jgi:hypothetical protein